MMNPQWPKRIAQSLYEHLLTIFDSSSHKQSHQTQISLKKLNVM